MLTVLRYVERNPLRASLCRAAEEWKYGSAWRNFHGDAGSRQLLAAWPIPRPRSWRTWVNQPQTESELHAVRRSILRGTPFGAESWIPQSAARLQLKHTLRPAADPRPKNELRPNTVRHQSC